MRHGLGWRPDVPDRRDFEYQPSRLARQPRLIDLRDRFFPAWQQGTLGSCTAHAVGAACMFLDIFDRDMSIVTPSRLFLYYNSRAIEGTTASDEGAEIRNAIKSAAKYGYPSEDVWRYRLKEFTRKPPAAAYKKALKERVRRYERVSRRVSHFRKLLAERLPVVVGISIYESAYTDRATKTGVIPLPGRKEKLDGGHAILLVGYDDARKRFIFRNSWGTGWGAAGHGFLPYEYIEDAGLSDDFWVIKR